MSQEHEVNATKLRGLKKLLPHFLKHFRVKNISDWLDTPSGNDAFDGIMKVMAVIQTSTLLGEILATQGSVKIDEYFDHAKRLFIQRQESEGETYEPSWISRNLREYLDISKKAGVVFEDPQGNLLLSEMGQREYRDYQVYEMNRNINHGT